MKLSPMFESIIHLGYIEIQLILSYPVWSKLELIPIVIRSKFNFSDITKSNSAEG